MLLTVALNRIIFLFSSYDEEWEQKCRRRVRKREAASWRFGNMHDILMLKTLQNKSDLIIEVIYFCESWNDFVELNEESLKTLSERK